MHRMINPWLMFAAVLPLVGCGGGGSGTDKSKTVGGQSSSTAWVSGVYPPAANFINRCELPRQGKSPITNQNYPDTKGSYVDENNFLRSWSQDTYLWYRELVDRNPANYPSTENYFNLLKTNAKTSSGADKDKYHYSMDSDEYAALSQSGLRYSYGMELAFIRNVPPRELRVIYVQPGSPAALQSITRGSKIVGVDGVDLVNNNTSAGIDTLNRGLFPDAAGQAHTFDIQKPGASQSISIVMQSARVTSVPVQQVKTLDTETGKVGYFAFHDHIAPAEVALRDAIAQLQGESISDLVIDLRYNGGGYLAIASQLAYMIAGASATESKTFELMQFNDKYPTRNPITGAALTPEPFLDYALGFSLAYGTALPSLNLSRVFVLTGSGTCSASEALMNGLRGIDVQVIQIGNTTCGKPYGFYSQSNCGTTYFSVQFRGVNAKNFGDYTEGFFPSAVDDGQSRVRGCIVADDYSHELGNPVEARLAAALYFRENGTCPGVAVSGSQKPSGTVVDDGVMLKPDVLNSAWMHY